jgi:AcrR family transcriptional regulator
MGEATQARAARRGPRKPPVRARRTHAERTAETREKLLSAVVASIAEVGLARTTAPEIARRAGVTWGAVQHHFGGKDGILVAVLDDSFRRLAERIGSIPVEGTALAERVSSFVERSFEHLSSPHYRSTVEILRHVTGRGRGRVGDEWRERMRQDWKRLWQRLFADARAPRARQLVLQHYALSLLSGIASSVLLEYASDGILNAELALLKETLVRELGAEPAEPV